jgi:hypothetical protein
MFTPAVVQFANVTQQACLDYPLTSALCADEIEQRIIRAYVRLMYQAVDNDNSRSVVVMRSGRLRSASRSCIPQIPIAVCRRSGPRSSTGPIRHPSTVSEAMSSAKTTWLPLSR